MMSSRTLALTSGHAASAPPLRATGAGIVFCQCERDGIRLLFPVFDRAMQIPRASLQICLWVEKPIHMEIGDLIFTRPFVGRFFSYLHEPALAVSAILSGIEPAFTPNDGFHQHRIKLVFQRYGPNEAIVLLKPRRTHPFVNRVNRIPR